ncbi:MAG: AAA family ATPase [Alphaproteobacteria bacterium]|nr:AAA family ATPase [Alphaproteobacteria bacterium]
MIWTAQQERALQAIAAWRKSGAPQLFRLFGYAGTGKTTLARKIAEDTEGFVAFAAFTGKAALVLCSKGCENARTIHSLIYRVRDRDADEPSFVLNDDSEVRQASLVIVDECSMVDQELGRDLLSFGTPVLVLGDPAQLPPVKGGGFFTDGEPDVMLTEVHRQAADNPIIQMSMQLREGGRLMRGSYGKSLVIGREAIDSSQVTAADQLLVGLNRTRRAYNKRMRELYGYEGDFPQAGDKLVCLRNDRTKGLLNGGIWLVKTTARSRKKKIALNVVPEEDPTAKSRRITVLPELFQGLEESLAPQVRRDSDEFDYGYALTVHKAQGSQWKHVVLFDESFAFREHASRWLYTGITRAIERLTVVV